MDTNQNTQLEEMKTKFEQAFTKSGSYASIQVVNETANLQFDPVLGAYPDQSNNTIHSVKVLEVSAKGYEQLSQKHGNKFQLEPDYRAYTILADGFIPYAGNVILFNGEPATITVVDAVGVGRLVAYFVIGLHFRS